MREIKIYGEIIPFDDSVMVSQGGYCNLTHVQKQLKEANGEDIRVRINSIGGDCDTGFAIYSELRRYAKENDATIETFGEARVASIATVIFLAGDTRVLTEHTQPFVHNAFTYIEGDDKTLLRAAADLKKYNERIAEHYAIHTELSKEEALELMQSETSITTDEAVAMRFATSIEQVLRPVAMERFNKQKTETDMNKNPKTNVVKNLANALLKAIAGASNKMVATADEKELDFYELGEDDPIEVGAKARVDGADAEGEYVMKSGETYVFTAGELTEIREAAGEDEAAKLQEEIDNLTNQLEAVTNASAKAIEAKDAVIAAKETEIATLNSKMLKFQNAASAAPATDPKPKPSGQAPAVENKAAAALAHLKTLKKQ